MVLSPRSCLAVNWYRAFRHPVMRSWGMTGFLVESNLWACQPELASILSVAYRTTVTRKAEKSGVLCWSPLGKREARFSWLSAVTDLLESGNGVSWKETLGAGAQWEHLWSVHSKGLLALHKVWWHWMSGVSLVLERLIKLEDTDPWGFTWLRIPKWIGPQEGNLWPMFVKSVRLWLI